MFKTALQRRDQTHTIPEKLTVWDQLVLQDTYHKKLEDEELLRKQHREKLAMREFYLG